MHHNIIKLFIYKYILCVNDYINKMEAIDDKCRESHHMWTPHKEIITCEICNEKLQQKIMILTQNHSIISNM